MAPASGDMTEGEAIEVRVELGDYHFKPDHLEFETGKLYKLVLVNTADQPHEFDSQMLAHAVFTRKVEVSDGQGRMVAEMKGIPNHVELGAGNYELEWYFVPVQTGEGEMTCELPGHHEEGMEGTVTIK